MSTRAASLEDDPSCALAFAIVGRGDALAGDGAAALAETCDPGRPGFAACAGKASDVARGIDRHACGGSAAAAAANATFANALRGSGDDIDANGTAIPRRIFRPSSEVCRPLLEIG